MRLRLITLLFCFTACAPAAKDDQKAAPYDGKYGKAGPGTGESCYAEKSAGLRCAEAKLTDEAALSILRRACKQLNGEHVTGTCTTDAFRGTCRKLREAPGILIRYYGSWDLLDAQIDCGEAFRGLFDQTY